MWLDRLAVDFGLADEAVTIIPENGIYPGLRLPFAAVRKHPVVVSSYGGAWVVCAAGNWALERGVADPGWHWGRGGTASPDGRRSAQRRGCSG